MHTARGDDITGIKRRHHDLSSDGLRNLATASGCGRLKRGSRIIHVATALGLQSDSIEQFLNNFANQPNETDMNNLESDDESVDTPLISPFPYSDNDSDDGEVLNELIECEIVGRLRQERAINSFDRDDLAFQYVHDLRSVEIEFPAIVFDGTLTSEVTLSCETTISHLNDNIGIDFTISFDESDDEDYTVSHSNDLDFFKDFEIEFPAIVYNDALTPKLDFLTEPTISPQHIDEFNLKDKTSLSEYTDNGNDEIDIEKPSGDMSVIPSPNVINVNAQGSNKLLETRDNPVESVFPDSPYGVPNPSGYGVWTCLERYQSLHSVDLMLPVL
ncbi:hypothetical protein Tco_0360114 [Tanacetum coccineum]